MPSAWAPLVLQGENWTTPTRVISCHWHLGPANKPWPICPGIVWGSGFLGFNDVIAWTLSWSTQISWMLSGCSVTAVMDSSALVIQRLCFLLLKSDKSSGKKPHQFYSFLSMFNLLNCFWHPGTFSERDSFVCYQKLPLGTGIKELSFHWSSLSSLSIMCSSVRVPPFPVLQLNIQITWSKDNILPSVD